ncbi:MAG: serine/threonine-protein phosphatase [Actinomycetota bacterium]|nr:serine/threonine-protein phosphatase [Actinomycetota bacterium]
MTTLPGKPAPHLDVSALLNASEAAAPAEGVDAVAAALGGMLGAKEVSFLIADISGGALVRLTRAPGADQAGQRPAHERVPLSGSVQGEALRTQQVLQASAADGVWLYAPVTQRGDTVGVLELLLDGPVEPAVVRAVSQAAHALAYVVIADRRFSDLYEWGQRTSPLMLAAEIQRRLVPASFTCEAGQFSLSGWFIPADEAGGDTFDYILDRETLHLSITDAMGHGVGAAQLATLAVGSLRNSRRRGAGVVEMAQTASRAVDEHAGQDQFITGQVLRLELTSGALEIVNAGHVAPLLVRDGVVENLALDADPAFGIGPEMPYRVQHRQLEPGDRLVLLTDGMYERNAEAAQIDKLLTTLTDLHPREAVQAMTAAVLKATEGSVLDDATALVLDWYGGPARERGAKAGAGIGLASGS